MALKTRSRRRIPLTPLQTLFRSVKVQSCTDGTLKVLPLWRDRGPGVLTRLAGAYRIQVFINRHLRQVPK